MAVSSTKRSLFRIRRKKGKDIGAPPGLLVADPHSPPPVINVIAYRGDKLFETPIQSSDQIQEIIDAHDMTWIDVRGLGDTEIVAKIGEILGLHMLALEDVFSTHQRPKVEEYEDNIFCIARSAFKEDIVSTNQINIFFTSKCILTLLDTDAAVLEPVKERIRKKSGKIRQLGPDYIAYAIIDAAIDSYYPVFEELGENLEQLEADIIVNPASLLVKSLHDIKRELLEFRRAVWPSKEALGKLLRSDTNLISDTTSIYLRDSIDHTAQLMDLIEYYREVCSDLMGMYLSSLSNKTNDVMKVLTIIATIFIPLTFLAGVYGMNFNPEASPLSMPELNLPYSYPIFWALCIVVGTGLIIVFRKIGWLGATQNQWPDEH